MELDLDLQVYVFFIWKLIKLLISRKPVKSQAKG
jgi:hypothetical protein